MSEDKYGKFLVQPPVMHMTVNEDGRQVFHGFMATKPQYAPAGVDCPYTFGYQIVTKPFKGDNPPHVHNFQEFIAWYGTNPDDSTDFDAEIELYLGEEQERHVITRPTYVILPPGLIHCPLNIVRVGKPIVQIEMMLPPLDGAAPTREPVFEEHKGIDPYSRVTMEYVPQDQFDPAKYL